MSWTALKKFVVLSTQELRIGKKTFIPLRAESVAGFVRSLLCLFRLAPSCRLRRLARWCEMAQMVSTATQPRYATAMFHSNQPEIFPLSAGVSRRYLPSAPNKATETVMFCFGKMFRNVCTSRSSSSSRRKQQQQASSSRQAAAAASSMQLQQQQQASSRQASTQASRQAAASKKAAGKKQQQASSKQAASSSSKQKQAEASRSKQQQAAASRSKQQQAAASSSKEQQVAASSSMEQQAAGKQQVSSR